MGDQKRWFKVWGSILTDPTFLSLPLDTLGRWTLLGALMVTHGENGKLIIEKDVLKHLLRSTNDNGLVFPNVVVEEIPNDNSKVTVIMKNWLKYQLDSTGYERLKRYRKSHNDNGAREEKIREEKTNIKKEKNITTLDQNFVLFWNAYPRKSGKKNALDAWNKAKDKPSLEIILKSIETQKQSEQWKKENGQFIPHPATWINAGRWDDEEAKPFSRLTSEPKPKCPKCGKENAKSLIWNHGCSICLRG